jgi:hypothetical protein
LDSVKGRASTAALRSAKAKAMFKCIVDEVIERFNERGVNKVNDLFHKRTTLWSSRKKKNIDRPEPWKRRPESRRVEDGRFVEEREPGKINCDHQNVDARLGGMRCLSFR